MSGGIGVVPGTDFNYHNSGRRKSMDVASIYSVLLTEAGNSTAGLYNGTDASSHAKNVDEEGFIFGVPLELSVARCGVAGKIPLVVWACIRFLEKEGERRLETEGIYRVPGSMRRMKDWAKEYERFGRKVGADIGMGSVNRLEILGEGVEGEAVMEDDVKALKKLLGSYETVSTNVDLLDAAGDEGNYNGIPKLAMESVATVASLLKKYLGTIPGTVLGGGLELWAELDGFVNQQLKDQSVATAAAAAPTSTGTAASPPSFIRQLRTMLFTRIPHPVYLYTSAYLFRHLNRIAKFSEKNKMTPENLGIVFFPYGFRVAGVLIECADVVFEGVECPHV
jgi:hypothetical protein